jgi:hypothetical protein
MLLYTIVLNLKLRNGILSVCGMMDGVHLSGEHTSFLEHIQKTETICHEFVLEEKAKLLKACSDNCYFN